MRLGINGDAGQETVSATSSVIGSAKSLMPPHSQ
jgi:hypothetical protein